MKNLQLIRHVLRRRDLLERLHVTKGRREDQLVAIRSQLTEYALGIRGLRNIFDEGRLDR